MTTALEHVRQIPGAIEHLLADGAAAAARAADGIRRVRPRWAATVSRRDSRSVAMYIRYLLATCLGIATGSSAPSVTTVYRAPIDWRGGLLVAASRTGDDHDVVGVLTEARIGGAVTVAVTGELSSQLVAAAEHALVCAPGPGGAADAATTYVAQLTAVAALVARVRPSSPIGPSLARLPDALARCAAASARWVASSGAVESAAAADRGLVLSRGYNLATALETAAMLGTRGRLPTTACSTADVSGVGLGAEVPVVVFRPDGEMGRSVDEAITWLTTGGVTPWLVGGPEVGFGSADGHRGMRRLEPLALPLDLPEALTPPALVLPGVLLAEGIAEARGIDDAARLEPAPPAVSARGRRRS